jgi:ABC-type multidrug transport system fused ATPase/permease subunit
VQDALAKSGDVASEVRRTKREKECVLWTTKLLTFRAEQVIGAIRTVRSFSKDFDEVKKYTTCVEESYRLSAQRAIARGVFAGIATQVNFELTIQLHFES